jgi:uncharacterized membrane protein YccF (DUF307 family)
VNSDKYSDRYIGPDVHQATISVVGMTLWLIFSGLFLTICFICNRPLDRWLVQNL